MKESVTAAFQQQLAKRRENIMKMFTNPEEAIGEMEKADNDVVSNVNEDSEDDVTKGCGDAHSVLKDDSEDGDFKDDSEKVDDESEEDDKTDSEKAEIIDLIGVEQLDVWKAMVNEINETDDETIKAEILDSIDSEIENFSKVSEVEKSDILYALSGYESKIKFKKSGSEVKEQLTSVVIPNLNSELSTAKSKADEVLRECGGAPTHDVPEYWTGELHIEIPYKFYEWDETRVPETNNVSCIASFSPDSYKKRCCKNAPVSQDEADARCLYNEQIRKIANIITDIKACEIVAKNLKDNESVELSVKQLVAFKFA